jgi:hypothetical protein
MANSYILTHITVAVLALIVAYIYFSIVMKKAHALLMAERRQFNVVTFILQVISVTMVIGTFSYILLLKYVFTDVQQVIVYLGRL